MSGVCGVLLAGGESRRMGRDKLSLEVGGAPMVLRVFRFLDGLCDEVVISGSAGRKVSIPGTRRVPDSRGGGLGPLAGLEAGLEVLQPRTAFVTAGDMPFPSEPLARALLGRVESGAPAAVPVEASSGRVHPLFAAYDGVAALRSLPAALDAGERSMRAFLDRLDGVEYVEVTSEYGDPEVALMNVNSPEDLLRARGLA